MGSDWGLFFALISVCSVMFLGGYACKDIKTPDIRNYYDQPYCESAKVGSDTIERCYKVVPIQK